jgi:hypothetical protein
MTTNDPDTSWRGIAITQANMIEIVRRAALQFECRTCGRLPCLTPGFCRVCRQADRKVAKAKLDPKIDNHHGAAASTIEALLFGLRERGTVALDDPEVWARLAQLSDDQVVDVAERLQRIKPEVGQAWRDDQINKLLEATKSCIQETS